MHESYGQRYAELYHRHWWWRSREAILLRVIQSLRLPADAEILDFGCGDGLFLPKLEQFGRVRGIEVDETLVRDDGVHRHQICTRPLGDTIYQGWQFDLITALDVLEHIEDDRSAVAQLVTMLRPGGRLLVTVPAFPSLWDEHDQLNRHVRRYRKDGLRRLLEPHGRVTRLQYLFHTLFLPKWLLARWNRRRRNKVPQHGIPPRPINKLLTYWNLWEFRALRSMRIPFGTSLMAVLET
jgi:SAM-dependent methyltransferase